MVVKPMTDKEIIGSLLQEMDVGKDFVSGDNNYAWFHAIGKTYKPRVIVEMGTRFGYSLKAFTSGAGHPPEDFSLWVYDVECDGIKTLDVFERYFEAAGFTDINIHRVNTQSLTTLGIAGVDLAMVDGEHTESGCLHECNLAWDALDSGGIMVIDDASYEAPRAGVMKFCEQRHIEPLEYLPSLRGIYLIQKP